MAKETKTPETEEMSKPITFEVGEKVLFVPAVGEMETVEIVALPESGSSKYKCLFVNGSITPINACYLAKA